MRPWIRRVGALHVVRPSPIRIEGEGARLQFVGPLEVAPRVAGKARRRRHKELDPQYLQGADIIRIDGKRLFAEGVCRIRLLADPSGLPRARGASERQVLGVAIGRGRPFDACAVGLLELKVEGGISPDGRRSRPASATDRRGACRIVRPRGERRCPASMSRALTLIRSPLG